MNFYHLKLKETEPIRIKLFNNPITYPISFNLTILRFVLLVD